MVIIKCLLSLCYIYFLGLTISGAAGPPPVRNFTTITLYTDKRPWKEAVQICEAQGGRILDITYYSLFIAVMTLADMTPWNSVPIRDGAPSWVGLHRQLTPMTDVYYSHDCQKASDYKMTDWGGNSPTVMDGDPNSFCVHQQTVSTPSLYLRHDFTRANCQEPKQFYCLSESDGPCNFTMIPGHYGDTRGDMGASNDEVHTFSTVDNCVNLCLDASVLLPYPTITVVEECWGFTITKSQCILHIVAKSSFFNNPDNIISMPKKDLYLKSCFQSAINSDVIAAPASPSVDPMALCGGIMDNTMSRPLQVSIYSGRWTWNEAFITCNNSGERLLEIHGAYDFKVIQHLVDKYSTIQSMDYIWLGLHVPDPMYHRNTWVWSNCSSPENTNWDSSQQPSTNLADATLCSVIDTATNYWHTVKCNEQNYFICMGDYGTNVSYTNGIPNSLGSGNSYGPYNITEDTCDRYCSEYAFEGHECRGYAYLDADVNTPSECFIYTLNDTSQTIQAQLANNAHTLYIKLPWFETLLNRADNDATDTGLIPLSCCDVTGVTSECPNNTLPLFSDISSSRKSEFVLYHTLATWNEAMSVCESVGGTLAQPNDVIKWRMLHIYIESWIANGNIYGPVWIGLTQMATDDPCSLYWSGDCSRPRWTDFQDNSYTLVNTRYCTAVDNLKFVKTSCDQRLRFVCEIDAGPLEEILVNSIECPIGSRDVIAGMSKSDMCSFDCSNTLSLIGDGTMIKCLALQRTDPSTCELLFYVDPTYCFDIVDWESGASIRFKILFSSSVNDSLLNVPTDVSILPNFSCFDIVPAELQTNPCGLTPIPTTTAGLTSSLSTFSLASTVYIASSIIPSLASTTDMTYLVTPTLASTRDMTYLVTSTLASTTDTTYLVTPTLASTTDTTYLVTSMLVSTTDTTYLVTSTLASTTDTTYLVTPTLASATDTTYLVTSTLASTTDTTYLVTSTLVSTTDTTYLVTSTLATTTDTTYLVTPTLASATDKTYLVTPTLATTTDTTYLVTPTLASATDTTYLVTPTLASATDTTYLVTPTLASATDTTYLVTPTLASATDTTYLVTPTLASATDTTYLVTPTLTSTTDMTYLVTPTLASTTHMTYLVTPTLASATDMTYLVTPTLASATDTTIYPTTGSFSTLTTTLAFETTHSIASPAEKWTSTSLMLSPITIMSSTTDTADLTVFPIVPTPVINSALTHSITALTADMSSTSNTIHSITPTSASIASDAMTLTTLTASSTATLSSTTDTIDLTVVSITTTSTSFSTNETTSMLPVTTSFPTNQTASTAVITSRFPNVTEHLVKPIYIWPCLCHSYNKTNMTHAEWEVWLAQTIAVDKYNTSRYRRRLNSAIDMRTSSMTIGSVAASVLVALLLSLVVADTSRVSRCIKSIFSNNETTNQRQERSYPS